MDIARFDELKHSIKYGGLPDVSNETFTKEQEAELKTVLDERAEACAEYFKGLNIETSAE